MRLCESRTRAAAYIRDGKVTVDGAVVRKPSADTPEDAVLEIDADSPALVSRAQQKLEAAMAHFALDCAGLTVLDVGASTGGFTRCLLDRGAKHVYALDVGHCQLHPSLRTDGRVTAMEGVNARHITPDFVSHPAADGGDGCFVYFAGAHLSRARRRTDARRHARHACKAPIRGGTRAHRQGRNRKALRGAFRRNLCPPARHGGRMRP